MKKGKWDSSDEEDETIAKKKIKIDVKTNDSTATTVSVTIEANKDNSIEEPVEIITKKDTEDIPLKDENVTVTVESEEIKEVKYEKPTHIPMFDGCRSVENYQRLNFIDQGTYGMVFKARDRESKEIYALKQIKFGSETSKLGFPVTALREVNILLTLQHPNIVRVKEVVVGSSIDKIYMVMEYCENDLKTCMRLAKQSFSTAEVKQLMIQLLSAVDHMHQRWYIHRDLKTSNLLYSNKGYLTVCDFGLARKYGSPIAPYTNQVVTLWYRPPELLLGSSVYSTPLDVWSVGCIFAEMLTGEPLFPGQGEADQITKIFRVLGAPNEEKWPGFSKLPLVSKINWRVPTKSKLRELFPKASFKGGISLSDLGLDLLSKLLHMDPKQRITAADALNHEWLCEELPKPTPINQMPTFQDRQDATANNS